VHIDEAGCYHAPARVDHFVRRGDFLPFRDDRPYAITIDQNVPLEGSAARTVDYLTVTQK
jgi:hypothetical protein